MIFLLTLILLFMHTRSRKERSCGGTRRMYVLTFSMEVAIV